MASNNTGTTTDMEFVGENKIVTVNCEHGLPGNKRFLDFIQNELVTYFMQEFVTGVFGNETMIFSGCKTTPDSNYISSGVVLINGVLLPFAGGTKQNYVKITDTVEEVTFKNNQKYGAYKKSVAEFTSTNTGLLWSTLNNNRLNILGRLQNLKSELDELRDDFISHTHATTGGGVILKPNT